MRASLRWLGLAGLLAAACTVTMNGDPVDERSVLMERDRAWSEAPPDVEKFMTYFAPDASVYPPGMPMATGTAAIREVVSWMFTSPGFSLRWTPSDADVSGDGRLGYTTGTYEMSMNDPTGNPMAERGKFVTIWRKQPDGQWKVVHDIFNSDEPPPGGPPEAAPAE